MQKQFHFLCGLPRSGSTVLASILSQNPDVYASPNSPLVTVMVNVHTHLQKTEQARAFLQPTQIHDVLQGIMDGMYHFSDATVVLDKSRAWPHLDNIALLTQTLGYKPKFVATVRDLPSIVSSFVAKIESNPDQVSFVDEALLHRGLAITTANRSKFLFSEYGPIHEGWHALQKALASEHSEQFFLVEYDDLIDAPEKTLAALYNFLEIDPFIHDFKNIQNLTPEDDAVYKIPGLHSVRPELKKESRNPAEVIGYELYERFADIPHFWRKEI